MIIGYKKRGYIFYVSLKTMYSTFENLKKKGIFKQIHRNPPGKTEFGIGIVRNPYSRVESFYKDKMIQAMTPMFRQSCQKYLAKVFDRQRLIDKKISFQEFVLNGLGKNLVEISKADGHLNPQSDFIPRGIKKFVHIECPEEMEYLSGLIGVDLTEIKSNNTNNVQTDLTWTPEMRKIVKDIYREDFNRFGY
jgi:hypothetical protein